MSSLLTWVLSLSLLATAPLADDAPARLEILPARISLSHARDHQRVVVLATWPNGVTKDVTAEAALRVEGDAARLAGGFVLAPHADGKAVLVATLAGKTARGDIEVAGVKERPPTSFANEVVPVLTRNGCNAGSCHGAAAGKNGFRLSLFGYDKGHDYLALTRELRGRRLEAADPDASLMLMKPTARVPHKGGKRLTPDSPHYALLRDWIAAGASDDVASAPRLVGIEILPAEAVIEGAGRQQLLVRARYADGSDCDVTDLALLSSSNEASATVDVGGTVQTDKPGEAFVLARFGTFAVVSQLLVLEKGATLDWPTDAVAVNYIDEAIFGKLRKLRLAPAPLCDDATFLRRAWLDILNVLPEPEAARRFLADASPDKRQRLVEELLRRPEFPDVWAMQWAEVLRIESRQLERKGMQVYTEYLREAFRDDVPFDRLVRELLQAKGGNFEVPAANFFLTERDPKLIAESVAQNFLGIRIQCAQCHNHPFERWTMDDYYGFAAFFAQVGAKRGEDPRERIVFPRGNGEVTNVRTNQVAAPRFLGAAEPRIPRGEDRRAVLATWLTAPDNPWFASNVANRVFARFFGRGIVEPPDDVRVSNPPSHPGLHEELGRKLVAYGYDLRRLIRDICASRSYQLAAHPAAPPAATFAGASVRRLAAEPLLDAISHVCGVPTKYRGLPLGARATEIPDGRTGERFLELFGRPARTSACTCERRSEPTLGQVLHLINGRGIEDKVRSGDGRLRRLLQAKATDPQILEELWLAAYCRPPRQGESQRVLAAVGGEKDRRKAWEDVLWAVLNSKEFRFNH